MSELLGLPPVKKWGPKSLIGVIATVLAIIGTALTIMNQADIAEPHWLATRGFVRTQITQASLPMERREIDTQLFLAKSETNRIENEIANKQGLIAQNPNMPQYARDLIDQQIRQLTSDLEGAKQTVTDLTSQKRALSDK